MAGEEPSRNGKPPDGLPRGFKGVWMPRCLWEWDALSLESRFLLAEIDSLSPTKKDGCWAGNEHFQRMLGRSERQIQRYLDELESLGLVTIERVTDPTVSGGRRRRIRLTGDDLAATVRAARRGGGDRRWGGGDRFDATLPTSVSPPWRQF